MFGILISYHSSFYQIYICKTIAFPQLHKFFYSFYGKIAYDGPYIANIGEMRLQLSKLQNNNERAKAVKLNIIGLLKG